ncbi:4'-phosphopantetheinyl transferase family protein [Streptomyces sp. H27-D2]|uniref:4'-phosphopantetheinyl transferase family protein n=1 Tax=Streptomyces sp. H27-D2 TaxID=3046304 RepID=UPI002DB925EF|nr:4'-phosphopantetheinyl transferase superfamily protein [Streptomyces sp. H27-D2]MEC4017646.1 4'-phosphopantetheinyl transferase superfamily protein [Streptomyces sp. H27-D2]
MADAADTVPRPLETEGPRGPWDRVRAELSDTGTVVMFGRVPAWRPHADDAALLRPLLGRDWPRYESLSQPRMRERFAASRLLVRHAVAAVIDTAAELVDLAYQPGGRPYVRGCDQIDISLSHTEEMMVVGITRKGRIGVDVELADRRMAGTGSESQTCTPYERARLDASDPAARNDLLVRLWTLKEAYSKALGQGLRFRFTEFGFALEPRGANGARLVRPDGSRIGGTEWRFATFAVDGGRYVVSTAVYDAGFGEVADLSVLTALDEGLLDALLGVADGG